MKIQKALGAGVMSLGLVVGLAGFAGAAQGGTIDTTGPRSNNVVKNRTSHKVEVENETEVEVDNYNHQDAWSGHAKVRGNTRGGDARTGNASNANSTNASMTVDNSVSARAAMPSSSSTSGGTGTIRDTGPRSNNKVLNTVNSNVEIENETELEVSNTNKQTASSGDATVSGNTRGGNATTGNASNTNSTSLTFRVTN